MNVWLELSIFLSSKLMKYGFNHCFSIVDAYECWSVKKNYEIFLPISLSFISGCLIKKPHYTRMPYVQKFATGGAQPDGSLAFNAYNKIFFFALFLCSNHGKKETKEPLASKNKPSYCETKW